MPDAYEGYGVGGYGLTRYVRALMALNIVVFIFQFMIDPFTQGALSRVLSISVAGLMRGYIWQLVTYFFAHGSIMHLLMNMIGLYFMGPEVERTLGSKSFLRLYFMSGILGGLAWLAFIYPREGYCLGASGAVFGVLAAFATLYPNRPLTLLLFFVIPITMKAWILIVAIALVQFLYLISPGSGDIAYIAHLAGGLVGYLYVLLTVKTNMADSWTQRLRRWRQKKMKSDAKEIDRILDKIASEGIHSLTSRERGLLEKASHDLKKGR